MSFAGLLRAGSGKEKMTTVEDPGAALQKPDALPEVAATYCLPLTAYVSTAVHRPAGAESVKNLPVRASSVRKSPVISPEDRPADVVATAATIGFDDSYRHVTLPVEASTAVSQPRDLSIGSYVHPAHIQLARDEAVFARLYEPAAPVDGGRVKHVRVRVVGRPVP